jgi:hypothetical protein
MKQLRQPGEHPVRAENGTSNCSLVRGDEYEERSSRKEVVPAKLYSALTEAMVKHQQRHYPFGEPRERGQATAQPLFDEMERPWHLDSGDVAHSAMAASAIEPPRPGSALLARLQAKDGLPVWQRTRLELISRPRLQTELVPDGAENTAAAGTRPRAVLGVDARL